MEGEKEGKLEGFNKTQQNYIIVIVLAMVIVTEMLMLYYREFTGVEINTEVVVPR